MAAGAGAAQDVIYARAVVLVDPSPDPASFDRKDCSLVLFEIGLCMYGPRLPRQAHQEDREVPPPSLRHTAIMETRRPRVHPIYRPRKHHAPSIQDTVSNIATALAKARPCIDNKGK